MSYIPTYLSRVNFYGSTKVEYEQNKGIIAFQRRLETSPHRVDISTLRNSDAIIPTIILLNKEDENKKTMLLNAPVGADITTGDIILWGDEKWIIYQRIVQVNESYQSYYMVRCNYYVRWVNKAGEVCGSWCYLVSSMDSKIKGNYRTWHNLITPQPNKYLEMLLPGDFTEKGMRFIIEQEGWQAVEYDHTSVPNITYLSLTEEKANPLTDDMENEIADIDKVAKYKIEIPEQIQTFAINQEVKIIFKVIKNGEIVDSPVLYNCADERIIGFNSEGQLIAKRAGNTTVTISLVSHPEVSMDVDCKVGSSDILAAFIAGSDTIRMGQLEKFTLEMPVEYLNDLNFYISDGSSLASIEKIEGTTAYVRANGHNKLGSFTLSVVYNSIVYSKSIKVVALW